MSPLAQAIRIRARMLISVRFTGVKPLIVPSMLVGASSCAFRVRFMRRYELDI